MGAPLADIGKTKLLLNVRGNAWDDAIIAYLQVATDLIEEEVGPVTPRPVTETVKLSPTIVLSRRPVISVQSLTPVYPQDSMFYNSGYTYNVSDYLLDPAKGILRRIPTTGYAGNYGGVSYGHGFSGLITVSYTAGYATVPAAIEQAAMQFVREMLATKRGASAGSATDPEDAPDSYGMPRIDTQLLRPFRRPSGIA